MRGGPTRRFAELGTSRLPTSGGVVVRRAVVMGGSIAGLLAARVLSGHADEVVVLERDALDEAEGPRPGVPHGTQVHVLLDGGRVQLERWFPGLSADLMRAGGVLSGDGAIRMYVNGIEKAPVPDELLSASRPLLEHQIRRRALALPNVRVVRARASQVLFAGDRVSGVRFESVAGPGGPYGTERPGEEAGEVETMAADLVVDAMGRSSRLGEWLEAAGWPRPVMRRIGIDLNYATANFARRGDLRGVTTVQAVNLPGDGRRAGVSVLTAVEDGRWSILLSGFADDRPTQDPAEFRRRCRELPPIFAEVAGGCEFVGPVATYRQADSRRRDFHLLRRMPIGLFAAGDAIASFNPVYGQGMSSAALHASCLSAYLRSVTALSRPAWDYFRSVKVVVDAAWQTSTINDLGLPHVTGPYPPGFRIARKLSDLILWASVSDSEINRRFLQVTHMRAHPNTLVRPRVLIRAARSVRTGKPR